MLSRSAQCGVEEWEGRFGPLPKSWWQAAANPLLGHGEEAVATPNAEGKREQTHSEMQTHSAQNGGGGHSPLREVLGVLSSALLAAEGAAKSEVVRCISVMLPRLLPCFRHLCMLE